MKKSIAKNYIYNLIYQMLTIVLPLITTPYLSRVLGAENIGIYGYTLSIVTYFVLFGTLGIAMYGQREIAYVQNDKTKQSKTFWEIVITRFITLTIASVTFYITFCIRGEYTTYYTILLLELLANALDISWYYQGIEDFGKTVIRNLVVKVLSLVCIFVFVKTQADLWKYMLIYVLANALGNATMWLYLPKMLQKISLKTLEFKKHIKPVLSLFVPQIATQIYVVLDKTMIGNITNNMSDVGFYEQAQKIVKTAMLVVTALGTVMNSRIANAFAENKKEDVKKYLMQAFNIVWMLGIPITLGIMAVSSNLVPWFYGEGYEPVIQLLIATSPILLAIGLNNVTGIQYLIQTKQQKNYTISVTIGAIVNVIFNFILINLIGTVGAAISSVLAEFTILSVHFIYMRKDIKILDVLKSSIKYLISGLIMYVIVLSISKLISSSILNTFILIAIGAIIYFVILLILRDKFLNDIINAVYNLPNNTGNRNGVILWNFHLKVKQLL